MKTLIKVLGAIFFAYVLTACAGKSLSLEPGSEETSMQVMERVNNRY